LLNTVTLRAGGAYQVFNSVRSYVVIAGSNGATLEINNGGKFALPSRLEFPIPMDVGFTPGATSPLQLVLDQGPEGENWTLDANPSFPQEGDTPPVASITVPGQIGAQLYRNTITGKLIIPSTDGSGNTSVSGTVTANVTFPAKQAVTPPGATNVTYAVVTVAAGGVSQALTPATGVGACRGFTVTNLGTVVADTVSVADSAAHITANDLLIFVPFGTTSAFVPYDFTQGTAALQIGTPVASGAFTIVITAYWS
jgi:hypothetical protein